MTSDLKYIDPTNALTAIMDGANEVQTTPLMYALACILDQLTELTCTLNEMDDRVLVSGEYKRVISAGVKDALRNARITTEGDR